MKKCRLNVPLYLMFATNCIYAVTNRAFNWFFFISAVLTALTLAFDIYEVIKSVRKK